MRNCILLVAILSAVAGCGSADDVFINHDKWIVDVYFSRNPLKHQPQEILDSFYIDLSDTTLDAKGYSNTQETYQFDNEGNIVVRKLFIDSVGHYDMSYKYDKDGRHHHFRSYDQNGKLLSGEIEGTSVNGGNGLFRVSELTDGKPGREKLWRFENNGSKVTEEQYSDKVLSISSTYEYKGDRLLSESRSKYGRSKILYYYSNKGFLDSVASEVEGNTGAHKIIKFINNESGDPVFQTEILNGDTNYSRRIQYRYDKKGNWVRRLVYETGLPDKYLRVGKNPEYTLTVRRIKY